MTASTSAAGIRSARPKRALEQAGGDDELGAELRFVFVGRADLGCVRFGDDRHGVARQQGLDAGDIGGIDLGMQFDRGVGAAVDEVADRIGLDGGLRQFPERAEGGEFGGEVDRRRRMLQVGIEEAETALIGAGRGLEAVLLQGRRR